MTPMTLPFPALRRVSDAHAGVVGATATAHPAHVDHLRVLVIGDIQRVTALLRQAGRLSPGADVHIDEAPAGLGGRDWPTRVTHDLIILDALCPGFDGPALCRHLRADGVTSLLVILDGSPAPADVIAGFDAGADAYLARSIDGRELRAHLAALLRRRGHGLTIHVRDLTLDVRRREARRGGRTLRLTDAEYATLVYLVCQSGRVVTRARLATHLWGDDVIVGRTVVDEYLIEKSGARPPRAPRGRGPQSRVG